MNRLKVIEKRLKFLAPSLRTFEAFDNPLVLKRGHMQYMWDTDDNKYIDLLGQNLCISIGHAQEVVVDAAVRQMKQLPHCTTMYYHEQSACFAEELIAKVPAHPSGEDWVVHFVNDGSEAIDLAVQMAREYTQRPEMIGLQKAYHGLHGYAAGLTAIGKAEQSSYSSMYSSISHVEANNLPQLEKHLEFTTGGKIAGMVIEPLQGYGGIHSLDDGYMKSAFELVQKYGGVTIADEVQTGYGRCGKAFWGFQLENNNVIPDMITIAKGMGNGVGIIGAVIARRSIAEAFANKMFFNTYAANPVACAAGRAVLREMDKYNTMENCNNQGKLFKSELTRLCNELPYVYKEVRGEGLFQGLEINGATLEKSGENAYKLHRQLLNYGVVVGRGSAVGNVFRIQPPMCIESDDVKYVVEALRQLGRNFSPK
jgi:alanine-glyoxylate transaminase / (R)-3-amino-2-methylpropionate-pyruvate transaminase